MQPIDISTAPQSVPEQVCDERAWILVRGGAGNEEQQILVDPSPFTVGRRPGCSMQLNYKTISGNHAELFVRLGQLQITDLSSTNGTYVNGRKITETTIVQDEDLIQFADIAFRLKSESRATTCNTIHEDVCDKALALVQFDRLMENKLVTPFYQPIIDLKTDKFLGYEVLARSRLFGLESVGAMFEAAQRLNMEVELSRMLRWEGIRQGLGLPNESKMFVNTHPLEIRREGLVESMASLRQLSESVPVVLEVHEAAITDPNDMRTLKAELRDLGIGLAYDDFGAGQTRLAELIEAPPDYLKFDISLIRDIDSAPPERQKMLASLVSMAIDLGINPLAEGVETEEEAEFCRNVGFSTAQGYFFGRPAPMSNYA